METPKRFKVLLIDDNENMARLAKMFLEKNYDVTVANDGQGGLAKIQEASYDVVLLDFHLPDIEGEEMIKKVKSAAPKTLLVVISGDVDTYGKDHFRKMGADDSLSKGDNWFLEIDPLIKRAFKSPT